MNVTIPNADPNGPQIPQGAVPPPQPPQHIQPAPPAPGAIQQNPAPAPRRSRLPQGIVIPSSGTGASGAPSLLELGAAYPMSTEQAREPNRFVPDAQMLFHVLGTCDHMMTSTDRFIKSSPAWLPIVSQLYIAVLWLVMILHVYVRTSYGSVYTSLFEHLYTNFQLNECMIPGPLVPFFQSLGAVNGPFDWTGDILPYLPDFFDIWDRTRFHVRNNFVRSVPCPALILDQLYHFATWVPPNQETVYGNFEWYRNVFSQGLGAHHYANRLGPQLCGSLHATQSQVDAARSFWNAALSSGITRINAAQGQLTSWPQLFGFVSQTNGYQVNWLQHVICVMQKYSQYFNGSVPLKSISPVGPGAVVVIGRPIGSAALTRWFYPPNSGIEPFRSSRFAPRREMPIRMNVQFSHSDHELELQAEQYAVLTHTNMVWTNIAHGNTRPAINDAPLHIGPYWTVAPFRFSPRVSLNTQFGQLIASRYHQQAANRVD